MSKDCSICANGDVASINQALEGGESRRNVAARFNLSESAVQRHRAHLSKAAKPPDSSDVATTLDTTTGSDEVAGFKARAADVAARARAKGDLKAELAAEKERRMALELELRLGQEQGGVPLLTAHPAWEAFMRRLDAVLCPSCITALCASKSEVKS